MWMQLMIVGGMFAVVAFYDHWMTVCFGCVCLWVYCACVCVRAGIFIENKFRRDRLRFSNMEGVEIQLTIELSC